MSTLSVNVRYRPVRLGFCVTDGDMDGLRAALRKTHALWGGRYNPIIPLGDDAHARQLVRLFGVDCLIANRADEASKAFVASHRHLYNPTYQSDVFAGDAAARHPVYLDIVHPMRRLHREFFRSTRARTFTVQVHSWQRDDPLQDVFLATLGDVPDVGHTGTDYKQALVRELEAVETAIGLGDPMPIFDRDRLDLGAFKDLYLNEHFSTRQSKSGRGVFVGSAENFADLVAFWNLRATGAGVTFFDPQHATRLAPARDARIAEFGALADGAIGRRSASIWYRRETAPEPTDIPKGWMRDVLTEHSWNGLNLTAPLMFINEESALASVEETASGAPRISFQLPQKGMERDRSAFRQNLVATVSPGIGLFNNERWTLATPCIPELNEYYGRTSYFEWNRARVEPTGLGIVITAARSDISLNALSVSELVANIFKVFGIAAEPSQPGHIANRLIQQMGGVQGCRVFKIAGVRALIETHRPDQTFRSGAATQTIFGQGTQRPLDSYKHIYIEPRPRGRGLKATDVFAYLLRKGIFRAGLEFQCPSCQLRFWSSIDNTRSHMTCEFCGESFDVTPMLRDRDWAYRRSGLFGRADHQEGAIPVVLTLQQLDSVTHSRLYATAMKFAPDGAAIDPCETDFVFLGGANHDGKIQIAIGECKTRGQIEAADIANLRKIAEAFPSDRFEIYVVFAKLASFTPQEVALAHGVNDEHHGRLILLSDRELEPYFVYERSEAELGGRATAVSLDDLAQATDRLYPELPSPGAA